MSRRTHLTDDKGKFDPMAEVLKRVRRIETRVMKGFEQLGATITHEDGRIIIDHDNEVITIKTMGTTVGEILTALGNNKGEYYVVYNDVARCILKVQ
jgi:hypothetical protein